MVKKISGNKPPASASTGKVESTKAVQTGKVSDVSDVRGAEKQAKSSRVRRPTRPMTAEEREHLFKLIHEEADKMFGANGLPQSQRATVENAVKQTVDASIVEDDDS
ncbi:MAG: hypothetical protein KDD66_10995 [Bdellovibrionales bacterium]|nr:hypothetical protein [Bdellovibrionales bacterium]